MSAVDHNFYFLIDSEDDAIEVYKALEKLKAKYNQIAIYFGLSPYLIEEIMDNYPGDNAGILKDIILEWVRQNYDTEKFGYPCWRKVVEAAVGTKNKLLAQKIAKSHPGKYSFHASYIRFV